MAFYGSLQRQRRTLVGIGRLQKLDGDSSHKTKRGFVTKCDALAWEKEIMKKSAGSLDITFNSFYENYQNDL